MASPKHAGATRDLLGHYERMLVIRGAEERLSQMFADGEVPGFIHLSIGQEATAVGVAAALIDGDTLSSTHRGHGHALAKGVDLDGFFQEVMGKVGGLCGGRGGSMHVAEMSVGMLGANGIVAGGVPIALGSALAHQVKGRANISVVFFGDGALAEGIMAESMNLASLWNLPLLFVCENNGWAEFTPTSQQFVADLGALGKAYGIPTTRVDGNDVEAVAKAARATVAAMRPKPGKKNVGKKSGGPRILECMTDRVQGHFEGDPQKYRDPKELKALPAKDPIRRCARRLLALKCSPAELDAIAARVTAELDRAVAASRAASAPDFDQARAGVYSQARL